MTENHTTLSIYYKGWDIYQDLMAKAIAPLSADQLTLSSAPYLRSIGIIAAHIIAARVGWFHSVMGEGSADLEPMLAWDDDGAPARSAAELASGLDSTWQMIQNCLARWSFTDLDQTFRRREDTFSRQWIIWHVIEHDLHHGGELSITLGMNGLTAPDL
jgi:uncharacterized damage-inducible protein DinB